MQGGQIMKYSRGTAVRIKTNIKCASIFHKGGKLIFQSKYERGQGEKLFGIQVEAGICFDFNEEDYELIK